MRSVCAEPERAHMKRIRVYRNADCAKCARFARVGLFFDWLDRLDASTETPTTGPLRLGEVVVEDLSTGRILKGAEGIDLIFRNIPMYAPFRLLLRVPSVCRYVEKEVSGCEGDACEISPRRKPAVGQAKQTR
jgi:hypothetical protein